MRHSNIVSYKLRIIGWDMNEYYAVSPQHTGKTPGWKSIQHFRTRTRRGNDHNNIEYGVLCSPYLETSVPLLG